MKYEPFKHYPEKHRLFTIASRWAAASQFATLFVVILTIMVSMATPEKKPYAGAALVFSIVAMIASECFRRYYGHRADQYPPSSQS